MDNISYSKILVPTDGSAYSYKASGHAVYLARELGATVYALYVVNDNMAFHAGIHYSEGLTELEKAGFLATDKIRELCDGAGVKCEQSVIRGRPADVILRMAEEHGISCIVMGSIGMSSLERILIGSVSEKVLHQAKCPVLLVRQK